MGTGKINLPYQGKEYGLEYKVIKSKRKTIGISINDAKEVTVKAPHQAENDIIEFVLQKKANWIMKKLKEANEITPPPPPKDYVDGDKLLYLGEYFPVEVREYNGVAKTNISFKKDKILIEIFSYYNTIDERRELIKEGLVNWYRKMAKKVIVNRVGQFSNVVGVTPNQVKIKTQKKRWGSCSSKGNLNFNWKLIMAPLPILDYVVVHELTHLIHSNHSKEFWAEVKKVIPDYLECREWLKVKGNTLEVT